MLNVVIRDVKRAVAADGTRGDVVNMASGGCLVVNDDPVVAAASVHREGAIQIRQVAWTGAVTADAELVVGRPSIDPNRRACSRRQDIDRIRAGAGVERQTLNL